MHCTVIIGYREADETRWRNLQYCLCALKNQTVERSEYTLVLVEQDTQPHRMGLKTVDRYVFDECATPYNRSRAINQGAAFGGVNPDGLLGILDADLVVPSHYIEQAQALAANGSAWLPYAYVWYMSVRQVTQWAKGVDLTPPPPPTPPRQSVGGALWIKPALFDRVGRMDERFIGWGKEDIEFYERLTKSTGTVLRDTMILKHLWHNRP